MKLALPIQAPDAYRATTSRLRVSRLFDSQNDCTLGLAQSASEEMYIYIEQVHDHLLLTF